MRFMRAGTEGQGRLKGLNGRKVGRLEKRRWRQMYRWAERIQSGWRGHHDRERSSGKRGPAGLNNDRMLV